MVATSPAAVAARQARFLTHLLNQHPPTTPIIIARVQDCLTRCQGSEQHAGAQTTVFEAKCIKDLLLSEEGDNFRECESNGNLWAITDIAALASLVGHLHADSVQTFALIEPIVGRLVHLFKKPKKYNPVKVSTLLPDAHAGSDADSHRHSRYFRPGRGYLMQRTRPRSRLSWPRRLASSRISQQSSRQRFRKYSRRLEIQVYRSSICLPSSSSNYTDHSLVSCRLPTFSSTPALFTWGKTP